MRNNCKRIALISVSILLCAATARTQSPSEEFNKFRKQAFSEFADFKSRILEHYADFLNGEWKDFEPILKKRHPDPKPARVPEVLNDPEEVPVPEIAKLPAPKFSKSTLPGVKTAPRPDGASIRDQKNPGGVSFQRPKLPVPGFGGSNPMLGAGRPGTPVLDGKSGKSSYDFAISRLPDPDFAFGSLPGQTAAPSPGEGCLLNPGELAPVRYEHTPARLNEPEFGLGSFPGKTSAQSPGSILAGNGKVAPASFEITDDRYRFDFYGMDAYLPECDFSIATTISDLPSEAGPHYDRLKKQEGAMEAARQLFGLAHDLGLNGYLTARLVEQYVASKFPSSDLAARNSTVHYLLAQMGYDARLATVGHKYPVVMIPIDQKEVFSALVLPGNGGKKFLIMEPEGMTLEELISNGTAVSTCTLPPDTKGKSTDLRITGLDLPMKARSFEVKGGDMTLRGQVNENMMKMLHHYPQMPYGDFASSWIDSALREDLVDQVKSQLAGMKEEDAVNKLMSLFHKGFEYETDQALHGFEKPYFIEENFLYPKNDCEDRAIMFSYLVWNALGLPCQLIQYPNHESTAVAVREPVDGYYYTTDGMNFYSADPTYIGSHIGMLHKNYRGSSPTIDKLYK